MHHMDQTVSANLGQHRHISWCSSKDCSRLLVNRVYREGLSFHFWFCTLIQPLIAMLVASPVLHRQCMLQTSATTSRHHVVTSACPVGRYFRQNRRPSSKTSEVRRCRTQCASSSDQPTSTSGRQDTQHALSHSDRYRRGQKGMPYKLISALALGGTALTAYLALSKLSGAPVVCLASGGCGSVLNSEYATVFGIPLSLLGLGAYSAVTALAVKGSLSQTPKDTVTRYGVLAGGAVLASCSSSLL